MLSAPLAGAFGALASHAEVTSCAFPGDEISCVPSRPFDNLRLVRLSTDWGPVVQLELEGPPPGGIGTRPRCKGALG